MPSVYIDSKDNEFKQKIIDSLETDGVKIHYRFTDSCDFYIVDVTSCVNLERIPVEKIMVVAGSIDNKDELSDFWNKMIFYKPLSDFEIKKIRFFISGMKTNTSDILSAVYITSKQLEKINNDFRERINELSKNISNTYIIDSQYFLDELIRIIIDYLSEFLKARKVSVLFMDNRKKEDVLYNIELQKKKIFKKMCVVKRGDITRKIMKISRSVFVGDIEKSEFFRCKNKLNIYNSNSFMAVPVKFKGEVVAVIYVTDKEDGEFLEKDLATVETIAGSLERFFEEKINKFNELLSIGISREKAKYHNSKLVNDLSKTITLLNKTQEELKLKSNELNILYNINSFVKNTLVAEELLKMIVDTIIYSMKVNRASVLLVSDKNDDVLVSGVIGKENKRVENLKIEKRGRISQCVLEDGNSLIVCSNRFKKNMTGDFHDNYETKSFVAVPVKIKNQVVAIINVTDKKDGSDFNEDDKKVLEILANQTAITIENFRLSSQLIEKEKITHELNIARDIQMKLMPSSKIETKDFDIDFRCIPAKEVGGDYVDFIDIDNENKAFVIGDVSGKGVPAALLMVMLRTLIRSFAQRELSPSILVEKVNNLLVEDIDPKVFATLFYGIINVKKKTIRFCNAGHNYPVILRKNKVLAELTTNDVVLGFFKNYVYHEDTVKLESGDVIYFYTDGVIEAQDSKGKIFSTERFYEIIQENVPEELFENLISEIREYCGSDNFSDDLTISYVRLK